MAANGKLPSFPINAAVTHEMGGGSKGPKLDVWSVFSPLAGLVPKDSINLGQGFMNWAPPDFALKGLTDTTESIEAHHYSLPRGRQRLREAISKVYSSSFELDRALDPNKEILVTTGANLAIYSILLTYLAEPGTEVLCIEPCFDQYTPNILFNGGKPVYVPLTPPKGKGKTLSADWKLNIDDLRAATTSKTRIMILNTPHNPVGKVFDDSELREIAAFAEEHDMLVIADEVYDSLTFGVKHIRFASLPGMWERTITVGSAGKSFTATGWRIGWAIGPERLCTPVAAATTRITFCTPSPLQEAAAAALEHEANGGGFFDENRRRYTEQRQILCDALDKLEIPYSTPQGAYFILVDLSSLRIPPDFEILPMIRDRPADWHRAWFVAKTAGVVSIPPSDFFSDEHKHIGADFIRLAFCKDVDTLREAGERLQKLKPYLSASSA